MTPCRQILLACKYSNSLSYIQKGAVSRSFFYLSFFSLGTDRDTPIRTGPSHCPLATIKQFAIVSSGFMPSYMHRRICFYNAKQKHRIGSTHKSACPPPALIFLFPKHSTAASPRKAATAKPSRIFASTYPIPSYPFNRLKKS